MAMTLSGPMFEDSESELWKSVHGKRGGHYNTFASKEGRGMHALRIMFTDGEADEFNFALFSTSGIHGCYTTIEEIEASLKKYGASPAFLDDNDAESPDDFVSPDITFVIVQPRLCTIRYGTAPVTLDDLEFLKRLRASSQAVVEKIGMPSEGSE